ncbi:hypothetical protein SAMN05443668_105543 [Cryptosporangium aurantiacum]|uniref:Uncharacterized protein n=1 Tax=Cryptosporangium aurantiacum TaxID=134849 RepID=A0A1M7QX90_9ACTN|nr:hypothetical protein SAMN05443668_105543 [Cryptosporangium aurantiacum]
MGALRLAHTAIAEWAGNLAIEGWAEPEGASPSALLGAQHGRRPLLSAVPCDAGNAFC